MKLIAGNSNRQLSEAISAYLNVPLTQASMKRFSDMEVFVEIMENFQYASQNFEEFSRLVKERPWLLVRKDAPPERKMP